MGPGRAVVDVPACSAAADGDVVVLQPGGAAHRGAERDAHAPRVGPLRVEARVGEGLAGGHHRELHVAVRPGYLLLVQPVRRRVEVALGGDPGPEAGRVEEGDTPRRGAAVGEQVPEGRGADAARGDYADAGDGHTPGHEAASVRSGGAPRSADSVTSVST